jgi:hypothetical protein
LAQALFFCFLASSFAKNPACFLHLAEQEHPSPSFSSSSLLFIVA